MTKVPSKFLLVSQPALALDCAKRVGSQPGSSRFGNTASGRPLNPPHGSVGDLKIGRSKCTVTMLTDSGAGTDFSTPDTGGRQHLADCRPSGNEQSIARVTPPWNLRAYPRVQ